LFKQTFTRAPEHGRAAVVISILSGKNGVGKTVVTFNLADRLAARGLRVLMVDGDLYSGNLHVLAKATCDFGLGEFADRSLSLKEAVYRIKPGWDLLGGFRNSENLDPEDETASRRLIRNLLKQAVDYDFILVDHSSGVTQTAIMAAHTSDLNLLLLVPELSSISDCYGLFKFLKRSNPRLDCRLLVNRTEGVEEAEYIIRKFSALSERFLGVSPQTVGFLPEDESVRRSVAGQTTLAGLDQPSDALYAFDELAARLLTDFGITPTGTRLSNRKRINGLTIKADTRE